MAWLSSVISNYECEIYPPGSKCKALRLGVHLILLYFISILFCVRRLFFYFVDVGVDVGDGGLFLSLNLNKNMVYSLCLDVYVCKRNRCTTKFLWVLKFAKLEVGIFLFNHSR